MKLVLLFVALFSTISTIHCMEEQQSPFAQLHGSAFTSLNADLSNDENLRKCAAFCSIFYRASRETGCFDHNFKSIMFSWEQYHPLLLGKIEPIYVFNKAHLKSVVGSNNLKYIALISERLSLATEIKSTLEQIHAFNQKLNF